MLLCIKNILPFFCTSIISLPMIYFPLFSLLKKVHCHHHNQSNFTSATLPTPSLHLHQSGTSSFLKPPLSCFLQLVSSISSLVGPVYVFHPLYVPLPSSKHLPQVISEHDHTTSDHSPLPAYLLFPSIPTCPSAPLYSSCPPTYTTHCPHHRFFCSS